MNSHQADEYLKSLKKFGIRMRLEHTERLLELLGNPHRKLSCIHVAGTNGKGSVCTYLHSILMEAGFKVGLYTSPHFYALNERIKINNEVISDRDLARLAGVIKPAADRVSKELGDLTFFEVTTVMAFLYYAERLIDYAVLEVGLGGRLDATNVVNPLVSVITGISREHTAILGSSLKQIAGEKAAIIKEHGLAVTAASGEALRVIEERCRVQKAVLCVVGDEVRVRRLAATLEGQEFIVAFFGTPRRISVRLLGRYQMANAAVAFSVIQLLKTFHHIDVPDDAVELGFQKAFIPCRLEVVQKKPLVLLDGAHNPDGIKKLTKAVRELTYRKVNLVFGCSHDKEYEAMAASIAPLAKSAILTETKLAQPLAAEKLALEFKKHLRNVTIERDVRSAVQKALKNAHVNDVVLVTGSLYVAGEARKIWHKRL
jgi:dihydrofolate synthase/folylpolyglutamate synthase